MALQKNIAFDNGLSCENAYLKVIAVGGGKEKAVIELAIAKDNTFADNSNYIEKRYYEFIPSTEDDADNFIKQSYVHLKTLTEFADAIDV